MYSPAKVDRIIFKPITAEDYPQFHKLLCAYYRDGEDTATEQAELDGFIRYLFDLCLEKRIFGVLATTDSPVGFVLWMIDDGSLFSNLPSCGTILEIGVVDRYRKNGLGRKLVNHAERQLMARGTTSFYVCAYDPAKDFWTRCGYQDTGKVAENGLNIFEKGARLG